MTTRTITKPVSPMVTFFSGQTILLNSAWTSCRKVRIPAGENEDLRSDSGVSFLDSPPDLLARDCFFVDITCLAWTRRAHLKGTNQWQARRDSNPQPPDLESGALPLELLACITLFLYVACGYDKMGNIFSIPTSVELFSYFLYSYNCAACKFDTLR